MSAAAVRERPILFSAPMVRAIIEGRKTQTRRLVRWPLYSESDGAKQRVFLERDAAIVNEFMRAPGRHPNTRVACPFGRIGGRLWARETWRPGNSYDGPAVEYPADGERIYVCDRPEYVTSPGVWWAGWLDEKGSAPAKPSIHMPRWLSRITLEVVSRRVERVQDISEDDAIAEGVSSDCECWSCCDGEHAGCCRECAGWCATDGEDCKHCEATGNCPKCDGDCSGQKLFARLWDSINGKRPGCSWAHNPWVWVVTFKRVEHGQ